MTKSTELPNKLSALIRVALADLRKCEEDPKYVIFMEDWHVPQDNGVCAVCLAGAVMAKSLNADVRYRLLPLDFIGPVISNKLRALNDARLGDVGAALCNLRISGLYAEEQFKYDRPITCTEDDFEEFHTQMCILAADLEKDGL